MDGAFDNAIDAITDNVRENNPPNAQDYVNEEGLLCCGKCHTRKASFYELPFGRKNFRTCASARKKKARAEKKKNIAVISAKNVNAVLENLSIDNTSVKAHPQSAGAKRDCKFGI